MFHESKNKDVFLYFHAPWCIHCKATETLILELGFLFQKDNHFQIYRIDGSKNEISLDYWNEETNELQHIPLRIDGFPTLIYFSRFNKTNPIEFLKERSAEMLVEFIKNQRIEDASLYQENEIVMESDGPTRQTAAKDSSLPSKGSDDTNKQGIINSQSEEEIPKTSNERRTENIASGINDIAEL
jgi:thiol-disulfide isomerase/thioredoxin